MREQKKRKTRPVFAVVVDGECEGWYLQMFKRHERSVTINIEPKIPQKKSLQDQYKLVCDLLENYTKVFWIIDFDAILSETRECRKGIQTPLSLLKEYYKEFENHEKVITIINNPCLEFWFLLHFESTSRYYKDCDSLVKHLKNKKYLHDYSKSENYYTGQNDIYLRLKPLLKKAIDNANKIGTFNSDEPFTGISEMQNFFEIEEFKQLFIKSNC